MKADQVLIFRLGGLVRWSGWRDRQATYGCSCKKNISLMNIKPPCSMSFCSSIWSVKLTDCATVEKNPTKIRAVIKDSKLVATAHQIEVKKAMTENQKRTGSRPEYAERVTTNKPPAPSIKILPTKAWFIVVIGRCHSLLEALVSS